MNYIESVIINGFWGDKTVTINLNEDVNFLIGVNGSGKTTIINLIASSLNADYQTLEKIQFSKILITLADVDINRKAKKYIEVEKTPSRNFYTGIIYRIKDTLKSKGKEYHLSENEDEDEAIYNLRFQQHGVFPNEGIKDILPNLVSISWLSINRSTELANNKRYTEKRRDSAIDRKIYQLSNDFIKYSAILSSKASIETQTFQELIFLSLLNDESQQQIFDYVLNTDIGEEEESLSEIYKSFKVKEDVFKNKLKKHYKAFKSSSEKLEKNEPLVLEDLSVLISTRRIHSVVQEWNKLILKQEKIYSPRNTFLKMINELFQRKELVINEKNELVVKTQSGKILSLYNLSSGEKQLVIILCESLLQQNSPHIYIADEPELSLHMEWQENLVTSLKALNPNSQIIFATHSPDIVGNYSSSILNVEETIK